MVCEWNAEPERKMNVFFKYHGDSNLLEGAEIEDLWANISDFVIKSPNQEIKNEIVNQKKSIGKQPIQHVFQGVGKITQDMYR